MKFTERQVQQSLYVYLFRAGRQPICPNYTPKGWFECDMFSLSDAGYATEHEIKLTVADFRLDFKKDGAGSRRKHRRFRGDVRSKHDRLEAKDEHGPKQFWFVMPSNVIEKVIDEVPDYAGVLEVRERDGRSTHLPRLQIVNQPVKKAAFLSSLAVPSEVLTHMESVFYWRYWTERAKCVKAQDALKEALAKIKKLNS